jgi:hypothetical protein
VIVNLCERFHCLPSQLAQEDASLIRLIRIVDEARPKDQEGGDQAWQV